MLPSLQLASGADPKPSVQRFSHCALQGHPVEAFAQDSCFNQHGHNMAWDVVKKGRHCLLSFLMET